MTQVRRDLDATPLALLAHELRTPLNAVIGYADGMRLQAFGPLSAPYDEQAGIIHAAALHLLRLIDEMADIAPAEFRLPTLSGSWKGLRERFNLQALVEDTVRLLNPRASAAKIGIRVELETGLGDIVADRRAIGQILINLLDNALKFTADGGTIMLSVAREETGPRIVVADSGAAAGVLDTVDRQRGRGLGLRLARALCADHDGSLTLDPNAGGGMTATVRLKTPAPDEEG
jgi:two-component system cell cycle sensor histidine kinase PleC